MLKFSFGWLALAFFYLFSGTASASVITGTEASCGVNKKCDPGYACIGAVGEATSGVCVANGVSVVMCRFTDYVSNRMVKYFVLFGVVFIGIFAWIGKLAWLSILSFVLGTGVILGGQNLLNTLLASNTGFCSVEKALACLDEKGSIVTLNIEKNVEEVKNLNPNDRSEITLGFGVTDATKCGLLGCVKSRCPRFKKENFYVTSGTPPNETQTLTNIKCTKIDGADDKFIVPGEVECGGNNEGDKNLSCSPVPGSYRRDYFVCQNLCTSDKEIFAVEGPTGKYADCQDFVKKNMTAKQ